MFNEPEQLQRILSVDDDPQALRLITYTLEREHFEVVTATSGENALNHIQRHGLPHLAIVDYNMPPGMSGPEFCRIVRSYCDLPIIVLSAVEDVDKIVASLEEYADDYIIKPFNPAELAARVQRVLRRVGSFAYTLNAQTVVDQRLIVDFAGHQVIVDGEAANLTPIESKLLYILMRNAGRTVTTNFLLRRIWPVENAQEDRLHVHIHRLRRKVEANPTQPYYILSQRGQGYSFPMRAETQRRIG
ncbi:MAG: response regulator transcription factor [Ardenticatenaceae bacterium]|nr:response regulator transcription factor [Anaerolineales bacterium]MCB8918156.1 response regulator transcription factor [Ardenticatenaceae bacterium]